MIDRRIDPSILLSLEVRDQSLRDAISRVADRVGGVSLFFDTLVYVAPLPSGGQLQSLMAPARGGPTSSLDESVTLKWPRLTTPQVMVDRTLEGSGWRLENPAALPFDLWPPLEGAKLTRRQWLTLLLFGFDMTYEMSSPGVLRLRPIKHDAASSPSTARYAPSPFRSASDPIEAKRVSFRVQDQPAERVLRSLAASFNLTLEPAPGVEASMGQRVTIEARELTLDAVLQEIGHATGLVVERDDRVIRVRTAP